MTPSNCGSGSVPLDVKTEQTFGGGSVEENKDGGCISNKGQDHHSCVRL